MSLPVYSLAAYFRREFGKKVVKVPLDAGLTCPNRDGRVGVGGCVFCNNEAFVPAFAGEADLVRQFEAGLRRLAHRRADAYLPYLQAYSATYAPLPVLAEIFSRLQHHPRAFGLAVSTRPDCLDEAVVDLLAACQQRSFFWVEIGVQTLHDPTLRLLNRGHDRAASLAALRRCRRRGLRVVVHLMVGLPGETPAMMEETVREIVADGDLFGLKFHPFHVLRGSPLHRIYEGGGLRLSSAAEYVEAIVSLLEIVPREVTIHRLSAEAPGDYLVAPLWLRDKARLLRQIEEEFARRGSAQGSRFRSAKKSG